MSSQIDSTAVGAKLAELAEAFGVEVSDLEVTIEDGAMTTIIDGGEFDDSPEGADEQSPTETDDDPEGVDDVEIHLEEMGYNELQKLASEKLEEFPEDTSTEGLIEALEGNIEDVEDISEADEQTPTESDTQSPTDSELIEMGVSEGNIEAVRKYRSKNGVCQTEGCPYGANDGEDHCASHQGSSSKSKTSEDSPKGNRELSDLSEAEKNLVSTLIEDEGKGLEEAIEMV